MELEIIEFNGSIEEFMEADEFEEKINKPIEAYYAKVYEIVISDLSEIQKELFDDWWYSRKPIPSDECFWKNTRVPDGYEKYTSLDIKRVHDSTLYACSMGCG